MTKQQKGWKPAAEAREQARRAHRKEAIRQGRKGAGAPEYQENSGCPLALLVLPWLLLRAVWGRRARR